MKFFCQHRAKLATGKKKSPCKDCPLRKQWEAKKKATKS